MKDLKGLCRDYLNYSIYSLKNKRCEILNQNIENLDERFYEIIEEVASKDLLNNK